jgi:hypothetical protein
MKKILLCQLYGIIACIVLFASCKKDHQNQALSGAVSNFKHSVNGANVKLTWSKPPVEFDSYELEVSKSEDFSVIDLMKTLDRNVTEHTFYKLSPAETIHSRIRMIRTQTNEKSDWAALTFNTSLNNVLFPISMEDISNNSLTIKWNISDNQAEGGSTNLDRVVIKPAIGPGREFQLSPLDKVSQSLKIAEIGADMKYTVTIYDGNFARGIQDFTTLAIPVNGVWTLSPYSNLKSAIENSSDGDQILLKPGIYDLSTEHITISNKSIIIKALSDKKEDSPKLYARGFELNGENLSLSFIGLNISGSRLNAYKAELSDMPDHSWNSSLLTISANSSGFDKAIFQNCIIRNYLSYVFSINDNNRVPHKKGNSLLIDNCIIYDTGKDNISSVIEINAGELKKAAITNSTFYRANKMFMKIDAEKNPANNVIDFNFKNNTVHNSWSSGAFDFKALKAPAKCNIENNNISTIACIANFFPNFAFTANTFYKRLVNTNFFNVTSKATIYGSNQSNQPVHSWELRHPNFKWNEVKPAFIMNDANHINPNSIKEYPVNFDPGFKDAENGDFTVSPSSPLRSLDGGKAIGDPRWW